MTGQKQIIAALARRWWLTDDYRIEPVAGRLRPGANAVVQAVDVVHGGHRRPCLIKRQLGDQREQLAWVTMQAGGAPIPDWYGAWTDERDHEVLLLERLPIVGIDGLQSQVFSELVQAIAAFNAVSAEGLPGCPADQVVRWTGCLERLWRSCCDGRFGPTAIGPAMELAGRWSFVTAWAERIDHDLAGLPWVPTHQDPAFANCGRRSADGPILLFDLGQTDRSPIGRDLALLLGGFTQAQPTSVPDAHWLAHWLREFSARSPIVIAIEELEHAVDLHRQAQHLWMDDRTIDRAVNAHSSDESDFSTTWGAWFARKWRALDMAIHERRDN